MFHVVKSWTKFFDRRTLKRILEVYPKSWIGFGATLQWYRLVPTITVDFWKWTIALFPVFPTEIEPSFSQEPEQEMTFSYHKKRFGI